MRLALSESTAILERKGSVFRHFTPENPLKPAFPYFLRHAASGLYLDVKGESKKKGAALILWSFNGNMNQQFYWQVDGGLRGALSGLALDLKADKGPKVVQNEPNEKIQQRFFYDGKYIHSSRTGWVLCVKEEKKGFKEGARIVIAPKLPESAPEHQRRAQQWVLERAVRNNADSQAPSTPRGSHRGSSGNLMNSLNSTSGSPLPAKKEEVKLIFYVHHPKLYMEDFHNGRMRPEYPSEIQEMKYISTAMMMLKGNTTSDENEFKWRDEVVAMFFSWLAYRTPIETEYTFSPVTSSFHSLRVMTNSKYDSSMDVRLTGYGQFVIVNEYHYNDDGLSAHAIVVENKASGVVIFAHRALENEWNVDNLLLDSVSKLVRYKKKIENCGMVQEPFKKAYKVLRPGIRKQFKKYLNANYRILVTGHSKGAGVAMLSMLDIVEKYTDQRKQMYLITFGPEIIGDKQFSKYYGSVIMKDQLYNYTTSYPLTTPVVDAFTETPRDPQFKQIPMFTRYIKASEKYFGNPNSIKGLGTSENKRQSITSYSPVTNNRKSITVSSTTSQPSSTQSTPTPTEEKKEDPSPSSSSTSTTTSHNRNSSAFEQFFRQHLLQPLPLLIHGQQVYLDGLLHETIAEAPFVANTKENSEKLAHDLEYYEQDLKEFYNKLNPSPATPTTPSPAPTTSTTKSLQ